jgi:amidase
MFSPPTADDVRSIATELGLHLRDDEVVVFQQLATEQLEGLDAFLQSRGEEERPPMLFPERAPGRRSSATEDPANAWLWRCEIGGGEGLLAGKTVSFKDHIAVAGIPLTFGTRAMDGFVPDFDATVVTRVLAEGGTVTGKNTHHGFGGLRSMAGQLGDYWDAVNPHDPTRQTGGSSSGGAVAVAIGDVDIAFGGDQGGSVRHPAAYCGVVGIKPTFGLISHMGAAYGGDPSIDHIGPLARTVEDAATALQAVAGYDGYDPRQDRYVPERIDVLGRLHDGVEGIRVGVLEEGFSEPIQPEVRDGVRATVEGLRSAGALVKPVSIPEHPEILAAAGALQSEGYRAARATGVLGTGARTHYPAALIAAVDRVWTQEADQMATYMKLSWIVGELSRRSFHGAVYAKAQNLRPGLTRAYDRALTDVDLLALPTCPTVAPPVPDRVPFAEGWRRELDVPVRVGPSYRNLQQFSYTGHPSVAVPCGVADGLPYSLQLVGRHFEDPLVLRAALAVQTSTVAAGHER